MNLHCHVDFKLTTQNVINGYVSSRRRVCIVQLLRPNYKIWDMNPIWELLDSLDFHAAFGILGCATLRASCWSVTFPNNICNSLAIAEISYQL